MKVYLKIILIAYFFLLVNAVNCIFVQQISAEENKAVFKQSDDGELLQEARHNPFIPQFPVKEEKSVDPAAQKENEEPPIEILFFKEEKKKVFDVHAYNLEGVVWGAYAPKAILNQRIYSIGDMLGEGEIVKIDKTGVTVLFYEEHYLIKSKNPFIEPEKEEAADEIISE